MACSLSSLECLSRLANPESEVKLGLREAFLNKVCMETKVHKVDPRLRLPTPADRMPRIPTILQRLPEVHQQQVFLQVCQTLFHMQILLSTMELSMLPPNTNFTLWVDINNKELATTMVTAMRNNLEVPFRVGLDTLK